MIIHISGAVGCEKTTLAYFQVGYFINILWIYIWQKENIISN